MSSETSHADSPTAETFDWRIAAPLASVVVWTGNAIVTKAAAAVIEPASITFYRWLIAFLVLAPFVAPAVWAERKIVAANAVKLAALGVLGMGLYQGLAYQAARTTSAVNLGVILGLMPLTTSLAAALLAGERLSKRALIGVFIALMGLVVVVSRGDPTHGLAHFQAGDALMLVAISSNAVYGSLVRRWRIPLASSRQLWAQIGFSLPVLALVWLMSPIAPITAKNLPLVLYAGIPASIVAPFFWLVGVRRLGAARAAMFVYLLPLSIAFAAAAVLGEPLRVYHAVGGALTLLGVAVAASGAKRQAPKPA